MPASWRAVYDDVERTTHGGKQMTLTRREFLQVAGAAGLAVSAPRLGAEGGVRELTLRAAAATAPLVGDSYPPTPVWAYGGKVPGPDEFVHVRNIPTGGQR